MHVTPVALIVRPRDEAARDAAVDGLVRDSDAVRDSVEIVRQRGAGDRVTALARWTEARTGRLRRGAVEVAQTDGGWRGGGGWSSDADHDSDNPVWDAWGDSSHSISGWVSDPAAATIRFRRSDGSRVEADTVKNGVAILIYDKPCDRGSVIEILDKDGNVLHTAPSPEPGSDRFFARSCRNPCVPKGASFRRVTAPTYAGPSSTEV